ncbi:hypothetical protein DE4381_00859 [Mycobacterium marinum]|nr:hypothetical protein DE4381_00859 [Mycobacterium marinum]
MKAAGTIYAGNTWLKEARMSVVSSNGSSSITMKAAGTIYAGNTWLKEARMSVVSSPVPLVVV